LAGLSKIKKKDQIFIGFGLESQDIFKNAFKKLKKKKLDLMVLQKVTKNRNSFGDKPIEAFLLHRGEGIKQFRAIKKQKLARLIIDWTEKLISLKLERREEGRVSRRA